MEKLYSFNDSKVYRFQCDCLTPEDAMDIEVEKSDKDEKYIIISMSLRPASIRNKFCHAFNVLFNKYQWREFVIREDDAKALANIITPENKFSELP
jgi:hypothetical protein